LKVVFALRRIVEERDELFLSNAILGELLGVLAKNSRATPRPCRASLSSLQEWQRSSDPGAG